MNLTSLIFSVYGQCCCCTSGTVIITTTLLQPTFLTKLSFEGLVVTYVGSFYPVKQVSQYEPFDGHGRTGEHSAVTGMSSSVRPKFAVKILHIYAVMFEWL